MQYPQVCNKHVVYTMVVLEICLQVAAEFTSAQELKTITPANTSDNMTTCNNCSSEALENKFKEENCSNSRGWNLRGADWGCCGNYVGCCTYASYVCCIHDALCRCCDIGGNFCGPTCKAEPGCRGSNAHTFQNDTEVHKNVSSVTEGNEEALAVETFEQGENHTEFENSNSWNYSVRGRATSGLDGPLFQDGDNNVDGSGDAE